MGNFFGIEVDIAKMTLQEFEDAQKETRNMLARLEHQILMRKKSERKYFSIPSTPH